MYTKCIFQEEEEKKVTEVDKSWNLYYEGPEDKPCQYDPYQSLSVDMFKQKPVDIANLTLQDILGNSFLNFRGSTERDREETHYIEEVSCEQAFSGAKFVGLFFGAGYAVPSKIML